MIFEPSKLASKDAEADAAYGFRVTNDHYRTENEISNVVASRDLKRMSDLGLLKPIGETRGRFYVATSILKNIYDRHQDASLAADPYELLRNDPFKRP